MLKEAIQYIRDLASVENYTLTDTLGVAATYTSKGVVEVKAAPAPQRDTIQVATLEGFAQLVKEQIDGLQVEKFIAQVVHHSKVALVARESDKWGRREELILAEPVKFEQFGFGQWFDQESFIIGVSAKFSQTDDKDYVLKIASCLTSEGMSVSEDNGFAQKATIKAGMRVPENVALKPLVELAPFRTFPECGQPVSKFVFRAQGGERPKLMLVEADGGKWKIDAMREVARYLSVALAPSALEVVS